MKTIILALLLAASFNVQAGENADCATLSELAERAAYSRDAGITRSEMVDELLSARGTIPAPTMTIAIAIIKWVYTERPPARTAAATVLTKCMASK